MREANRRLGCFRASGGTSHGVGECGTELETGDPATLGEGGPVVSGAEPNHLQEII